jgi:MFS transporter, DHA1 family, tetracycline resistance protein
MWGVRLPRELWALTVGGFLVAVGYGLVVPALPALAVSMGVGVTAVSAVVGAFALARIVGAPVAARLIRLGAGRVFCAGLVVVALSSAACAVAGDYAQLLAFRTVGGLGSMMFTVAAATLIIGLAPPEVRGRAFAAWSAGFLLGSTLGPLVGAALVVVSPRAPFVGYAAVLLAVAVAVTLLLREQPRPSNEGVSVGVPVGFRAACRRPPFRAALASNVTVGWTVYGVRIAVVPLYVTQVLDQPPVWVGIVLAAYGAGTVAVLPLGGRMADQVGRRTTALVGSLLVAATTVVLVVDLPVGALTLVAVLSGAGTALVTPAANAAVADVVASGQGTVDGSAVAGFQLVGDLGAVAGPVVTGAVAEMFGYPAGFALTAVVVGIAGLAWLFVGGNGPAVSTG